MAWCVLVQPGRVGPLRRLRRLRRPARWWWRSVWNTVTIGRFVLAASAHVTCVWALLVRRAGSRGVVALALARRVSMAGRGSGVMGSLLRPEVVVVAQSPGVRRGSLSLVAVRGGSAASPRMARAPRRTTLPSRPAMRSMALSNSASNLVMTAAGAVMANL